MLRWNPYGDTVYHGSPEDDLETLEYRAPSYEGGFGGGVYVDYNIETSHTYGHNTYELRLLLHDDDVFVLEPSFFDKEYSSILVGESVPPFQFWLPKRGGTFKDAQLYTVGDEDMLSTNALHAAVVDLLPESAIPVGVQAVILDTLENWDAWRSPPTEADEFEDALWDAVFAHDEDADEDAMKPHIEAALDTLQDVLDEADDAADLGLVIDLDDIGVEVAAAGYKALYVPDLRPLSEILVFDPSDLEMVGLVETRRRF